MAIFEPNIYMREIKELYSEELALLKQIRSYGREHSQGKMERVEKVKLLIITKTKCYEIQNEMRLGSQVIYQNEM